MEKKSWKYESPQSKTINFHQTSVLCSSLQGDGMESYSTAGNIEEGEIDW